MPGEEFREQAQHDFPVLQHVGDTGRRARIVFEHVERLGVDAHNVDASDMHVDIVRHHLSAHLGTERGIAEDYVVRHEAGAHDLPRTVDVLDESVQSVDALGQTLFQEPPFSRRHDARDDIEGDQALLRFGFPVNGEGDADAAEDQFGLAPPVVENVRRHIGEPARELAIGRAHAAVLSLHLIEGGNHSRPPLIAT